MKSNRHFDTSNSIAKGEKEFRPVTSSSSRRLVRLLGDLGASDRQLEIPEEVAVEHLQQSPSYSHCTIVYEAQLDDARRS